MSTTHRPGSPLDSPLDQPSVLIAALPAILGFAPEKSLVLVTAVQGEMGGEMGAVLRADLCAEESGDLLSHLAELAAASRAEIAIAVIVDDEGAACQMCADEYRDLARELAVELAMSDIELCAAHVVDKVAAGGLW